MCWLLGIAVLFLSHNVVGAHYPRKSNDEPVTFVSLPHKLISDCDEDILEAWQEKISEDQVAQFLRVHMPDRVRTIARIEPLPVQKLRKLTGKYYDDFIDFYSCVGKDCFWLANRMSMLKGQTLEFVVNNSTSMIRRDAKMLPGRLEYMSRFIELRNRLRDIFRLLSYFPIETVSIRSFSSISEPYEVSFQGKIPDEIFQMLTDHLNWIQPDYSGKPVGKCIGEVVKGSRERGAYIYVATDGELEGYEQKDVEQMLRLRNAEKFPITFLTCTRQKDSIAWLKDLDNISNVRIVYDPSSEFHKTRAKQGGTLQLCSPFFFCCQCCWECRILCLIKQVPIIFTPIRRCRILVEPPCRDINTINTDMRH